MADTHLTGQSASSKADAHATAFVEARLSGRALAAYPGALPATLTEAYEIQAQAISRWPDRIAGWKVGKINAPWDASFWTDRLVGPIFARQVSHAGEAAGSAIVFSGGFGAVEGEIVIEIGADAPAGKHTWTLSEATGIAAAARLGVEIASSPYAGINDHGPLVTISDFGNNNGLILGGEIPGWREAAPSDWRIRTFIDGAEAGSANASAISGGPFESLRAALEICARNGRPLQRGMHISTGAVTGVHAIRPGQSARIEMDGLPSISCRFVAAELTATSGAAQSNPA